jgi:hypothetical protein
MRLDNLLESDNSFKLRRFIDACQCTATDYSARQLKKPGNMLPALVALAKRFAEFHNNIGRRYLAGMWEKSLLDDLL